MDLITIRKGSVVILEGMPFELAQDTRVYGRAENLANLIERSEPIAWLNIENPCPSCGTRPLEHIVEAPSADNRARRIGQCAKCGAVELAPKEA